MALGNQVRAGAPGATHRRKHLGGDSPLELSGREEALNRQSQASAGDSITSPILSQGAGVMVINSRQVRNVVQNGRC